MERCDFSRVSSHTFERIVRALCFKQFGPAGVVFSLGPDGGRDFTIEGGINGYETQGWNGYLVVQSKFCEILRDNENNIEWLKTQINRELSKFKDQNRKLRCPEYYILATNVPLSGADRSGVGAASTGGYTKIKLLLEDWKTQIGIKDFDIWPADKISDLLSGAPEIRRTFAAQVTPGDVLTELLEFVYKEKPSFSDIIRRALKAALRRDQYVRLKDAGAVTDLKIRTSQVFIDLPMNSNRRQTRGAFAHDYASRAPKQQTNVVAEISSISREKFGDAPGDDEELKDHSKRDLGQNRIVLLGGPGQGKSTVGLFAAQLFRAALLARSPDISADPTISHLVKELLRRSQTEKIGDNLPLRYPVHITLPRFADAISRAKEDKSHIPSILSYIAADLAVLADAIINKEDVRLWLKGYPWLVVLDGLDEVPPSGERAPVIEAISTFVSEIADLKADVVILVTTRPQGYNSDLSQDMWSHWKLKDLPMDRALRYATEFSLAQYPDEPDRRARINSRLQAAAERPATSRLMVTPLQVTIMHTIVDSGGSVPAARWTLFNEYFEILKRREKAKEGPIHLFIEENLAYLGPIHQRAGLVMQIESELSGRANATIQHERFRQLLKDYLTSEGLAGQPLENRLNDLMNAAVQRLVLISTREEGKVSFEVRSLQEYTAAAALSSGDPQAFEARLMHVCGKAHWQHVLLIAASRCFSEDSFHYLRSVAVHIPRYLDTLIYDKLVNNGARLALDMFVDGLGREHPAFRRELAAHSLELLNLGPNDFDERLPTVWEDDTSEIVAEICRSNILLGGRDIALATWRLLLSSATIKRPDCARLIEAHWPMDPQFALDVIMHAERPYHPEIAERVRSTIALQSPAIVAERAARLFDHGRADPEVQMVEPIAKIDFATAAARNFETIGVLTKDGVSAFEIQICPVPELGSASRLLSEVLPRKWQLLNLIDEFRISPCAASLSRVLSCAARESERNFVELGAWVPWPVGALLASVNSFEGLKALSERALIGDFGDYHDWMSAQNRWKQAGITESDLKAVVQGQWFDRQVASIGSPGGLVITGITAGATNDAAVLLAGIAADTASGPHKDALSRAVNVLIDQSHYDWKSEDVIYLLKSSCSSNNKFPNIKVVDLLSKESFQDVSVLELVSNLAARPEVNWEDVPEIPISVTVESFSKYRNLRGLLPLIVSNFIYDGDHNETIDKLHAEAFEPSTNDAPVVFVASALLRAAKSKIRMTGTERHAFFEKVALAPKACISVLEDFVRLEIIPLHIEQELLADLVNYCRDTRAFSDVSVRPLLRLSMDRRKSSFSDRGIWEDLKLPIDAYPVMSQGLTASP
jgi:hypothetical protein